MLGSLGIPELLFIFGLALLIFGPKRLPEVGRALGKGMAELRKASNDLKRTINAEMIEQEIRDSDPRRIVRDSLQDVKKSLTVDLSEPPAKNPEAGSQAKAATRGDEGQEAKPDAGESAADEEHTEPVIEGSVARGSVSRGAATDHDGSEMPDPGDGDRELGTSPPASARAKSGVS